MHTSTRAHDFNGWCKLLFTVGSGRLLTTWIQCIFSWINHFSLSTDVKYDKLLNLFAAPLLEISFFLYAKVVDLILFFCHLLSFNQWTFDCNDSTCSIICCKYISERQQDIQIFDKRNFVFAFHLKSMDFSRQTHFDISKFQFVLLIRQIDMTWQKRFNLHIWHAFDTRAMQ